MLTRGAAMGRTPRGLPRPHALIHMRRLPLLALCCSLLAPLPLRAQSDSVQVMDLLTRMLVALYEKDTLGLRLTFDSSARMTLLRPAPGGGVRVVALTGEQFIRAAANPAGPALDEPVRGIRFTLDGDLATIWAEYQVRVDGRVTHCGHDAFHFVRRGATWRILNVSDTYRQQGCGEPWSSAAIDPSALSRARGAPPARPE